MNGRYVFAGIVERESIGRLTAGMTSEKWLDVPVQAVQTRFLIATQDGIYLKPLMKPETAVGGDSHPHVIGHKGRLYLEDGHHRAVRAMIEGRPLLFARVLFVD
jgi:hypothetical protein